MLHSKLSHIKVIFIAVLFVIAVLSATCNRDTGDATTGVDAQPSTYLNLNDTVKYVGMHTCKQCHQSIYDSFMETGMGQSIDLASHTKSSAKFDQTALIYDSHKDFYYKPFWSNDSLQVLEFRMQGKDTIHKRLERITYIIGSGQHTNSHMMLVNGHLTQVPVTYYTQKGKWDLPPGFENGSNTRFSRAIALECMSCHNAYPDFVKGSENKFAYVPQGINCERCHGPGEIHVKEKLAGKILDVVTGIDYTIVNPSKLPVNLQFDVCQRCHLQGNAVLQPDKTFYDFRPGMRLSDVMNVFMPVYSGANDEFIMASHAERLKMSGCYLHTTQKIEDGTLKVQNTLRPYKDALTCVTCHNPHVSVKATGAATYNMACGGCHSGAKDSQSMLLCIAPPKELKAKKNNCVGCHMPKSETIDIPHVVATDHYIRKPQTSSGAQVTKKFLTIDAVNNRGIGGSIKGRAYLYYYEKFDQQPMYLDSAAAYFNSDPAPFSLKAPDLIHLYYLQRDNAKVIETARTEGIKAEKMNEVSFSNTQAWTAYRIGESYNNIGNTHNANLYFATAHRLAPYELNFMTKYAASLAALEKPVEARKIYELALAEYPRNAMVLSNLGYLILVLDNNSELAMDHYNRAIALDPDYAPALLNKAGLLAQNGKYVDARVLLKRILSKQPRNAQAAQALKQLETL